MTATIIIPQRGLSGLTLNCIRTFQEHHSGSTSVVVVDDGSPRDDLAAISTCGLASVELISRAADGVTAAWNAGARGATTECLVFLNNDTATSSNWLPRLVAPLVSGDALVSGLEARIERGVGERILQRLPTRRFASGWCFAVRRDDFESICGFEPALKTYFSDTDLQARLLARQGESEQVIAIVGSEGISHVGHATTRQDQSRRRQWSADQRTFTRLWEERSAVGRSRVAR